MDPLPGARLEFQCSREGGAPQTDDPRLIHLVGYCHRCQGHGIRSQAVPLHGPVQTIRFDADRQGGQTGGVGGLDRLNGDDPARGRRMQRRAHILATGGDQLALEYLLPRLDHRLCRLARMLAQGKIQTGRNAGLPIGCSVLWALRSSAWTPPRILSDLNMTYAAAGLGQCQLSSVSCCGCMLMQSSGQASTHLPQPVQASANTA